MFATLLDNAGWFALAPYYDYWIATVELQSRLLESVKGKHLRAVGRVSKLGKRLGVASMEVRAEDQLVAIGSGTFCVTSVALPF